MASVAARTSAAWSRRRRWQQRNKIKGQIKARECAELSSAAAWQVLVRGMEEANPRPEPNIDRVMRHAKPCNALLALSATNPAAKSLQRKSCKVSKIKKPGDGANNTTHSLCLAVISDYSGQVLTVYRRGSLVVSIGICNATWQSIQVRASGQLASYQHRHMPTR